MIPGRLFSVATVVVLGFVGGASASTLTPMMTAGDSVSEASLTADKALIRVVGRVRDSVGHPIENALVWIDRARVGGLSFGALTDARGGFEITHVPVGPCRINVRRAGYESKQVNIDPPPSIQIDTVEIVLGAHLLADAAPPDESILGFVTDSTTGRGIAGVHVVVDASSQGKPDIRALSINTGRFVLPALPPGPAILECWHPEYLPLKLPVAAGAGETLRVRMTPRPEGAGLAIEPEMTIAGRVLDAETGAGLPKVDFAVKGNRNRSVTDDSGWFSIGGLKKGAHELQVQRDSFYARTIPIFVPSSPTPMRMTLMLRRVPPPERIVPPPGQCEVVVHVQPSEALATVQGVVVRVESTGWWGVTDSTGTSRLTLVPSGEQHFRLEVSTRLTGCFPLRVPDQHSVVEATVRLDRYGETWLNDRIYFPSCETHWIIDRFEKPVYR